MSKLIDELLDEHKKLFALLDEIRNISTQSAKEKLLKSKNLFISHLNKEDIHLYSKFDEATLIGVKVPENVIQFKKEMIDISKEVISFFDKYRNNIDDKIQFARDFGTIYSMLKNRMNKEELQLYPIYNKYFSN